MARAGDAATSATRPSVLLVWDFDWYVMFNYDRNHTECFT